MSASRPPSSYTLSGVVKTMTQKITVTRSDLLLTGTRPANPTPLFWDPAKTPAGLPLTATVSAAYKSVQPVKVTIYDTTQNVVKVLTQTLSVGGAATPASFTWDGTTTNASGQSVPAPKGIYLFQFEVGTQGSDYDTDKSQTLSFGVPATTLSLQVQPSNATGQSALLGYNLSDLYNVSPTGCKLDVYQNWDDTDLYDSSLTASLGQNSANFQVPAPTSQPAPHDIFQGTKLIYLVSPQDGDATHDKGGRNRYALQHNTQQKRYTLLVWGGWYGTGDNRLGSPSPHETVSIAQAAAGVAKKLNYNLWDASTSSTQAVSPDEILDHSISAGVSSNGDQAPYGLLNRCIDVAIFCGHGPPASMAGSVFQFGLNSSNSNRIYSPGDSFLVTDGPATQNEFDAFQGELPSGNPTLWDITSLGPIWTSNNHVNGQPVLLIFWAGCNTAGPPIPGHGPRSATGLPLDSVNNGALCSIGLRTNWNVNVEATFFNLWSNTSSRYSMQGPASAGFTVYQALHHAVHDTYGEPWTNYAAIDYQSPGVSILSTSYYLPSGN